MIAVIMAGGKGTRIASVSTEVPKPMIPLCGNTLSRNSADVSPWA